MKKNTYAAFYLPKQPAEEKKPDKELIDRNASFIRSLCKKVRNVSSEEALRIKNIAKNMDIQGATALVQKYATCALTDILTNQPVKDQKMLDYLFNTYAPALNLTLVQTEFNSLQEMYNAAMGGQINVANFVQGFSNSMTAITEQKRHQSYLDYGEDLPIDVVEQLSISTEQGIARRKVDMLTEYLSEINNVRLSLLGYVKNENAKYWRISDYVNKLINVQASKKFIVLRIGTDFYEKCAIENMRVDITSLYSLKITGNLLYNFYEGNYSRKEAGGRIMNPSPEVICDFPIENVFGGIKSAYS